MERIDRANETPASSSPKLPRSPLLFAGLTFSLGYRPAARSAFVLLALAPAR
jgi:hypothetical protein